MNVVAISGNLTRDIELKHTPDGLPVCSFRVAVRRPNTKDKTDFFNFVAWRDKAEFLARYFKKGQRIEIEGYLTTRVWEDKNKAQHVAVEIVCKDVSFGERKQNTEAQEENEPAEFVGLHDDEDLPF